MKCCKHLPDHDGESSSAPQAVVAAIVRERSVYTDLESACHGTFELLRSSCGNRVDDDPNFPHHRNRHYESRAHCATRATASSIPFLHHCESLPSSTCLSRQACKPNIQTVNRRNSACCYLQREDIHHPRKRPHTFLIDLCCCSPMVFAPA